MGDKKLNWWEYIQFVTPIFIMIASYAIVDSKNSITDLKNEIKDMRGLIVTHLCNAEVHIPRATVVSKDEFIIYQAMRDKQMTDIKDGVNDIKTMIREHIKGGK